MKEDDLLASRSTLLLLNEEQQVMQEGFHFLDEKRTLLANELLKQLANYKKLQQSLSEHEHTFRHHFRRVLMEHGLEALHHYPITPATTPHAARDDILPDNPHAPLSKAKLKQYSLLGVKLQKWQNLPVDNNPEAIANIDEQAEETLWQAGKSLPGEQFRQTAKHLLPLILKLAVVSRNLRVLYQEYLKTERRSRALEQVLIPELSQIIHRIDGQLEQHEMEEAIRVRSHKR